MAATGPQVSGCGWSLLVHTTFFKHAQLAGDGTYPWGEKFHGKDLTNQKGARNDKPRKKDKVLWCPMLQKRVNGIKCSNFLLPIVLIVFREINFWLWLKYIGWYRSWAKRVKAALTSEIGLSWLKNSNICLIMMSNTLRKPKNPNLVDIYWIKKELGQKGLKPFLPK